MTLIIQENSQGHQAKQYIWRDGYAVSVSAWSLSAYRERLQQPEEAIFAVPGIQEARILLEKDGAFRAFQQEVLAFRWEPLQFSANAYAGQTLMDQTEIILKMFRALQFHNMTLLAEVILLDLVPTITEAFVVQRGILIRSGNTYFQQAQEAAGQQSAWTHFHRQAVGVEHDPLLSLEQRGIATLRLFQETARLLQPFLHTEHQDAITPLIGMIDRELSSEKIG